MSSRAAEWNLSSSSQRFLVFLTRSLRCQGAGQSWFATEMSVRLLKEVCVRNKQLKQVVAAFVVTSYGQNWI